MSENVWLIIASDTSTLQAWVELRGVLWPETKMEEHRREAVTMMAAEESASLVRLALNAKGRAAGFIEATLRTDYVNGCETSPVAFLEGLYVEPWARRQGAARALVAAAEAWGRERGCSELASDALLGNTASHHMHARLGFEETEKVVYFRKALV